MDGLTALERELLKYVERLTKASEESAQGLRNLEKQLNDQSKIRLNGLADCVWELLNANMLIFDALKQLSDDEKTLALIAERMNESSRHWGLAEDHKD
jgi:hypothetical protein